METKTRRLVLLGLGVGALALACSIVLACERIGEFGRAESVKGYWASLQDFVKQNGHYPKDEAEIAAFFHTTVETEPTEYVAPHDDSADDVILWWKQRTMLGVKVGITKSGKIIKK